MTPRAEPGMLTEREHFLFATTGDLVIPDALSPDDVRAYSNDYGRLRRSRPR